MPGHRHGPPARVRLRPGRLLAAVTSVGVTGLTLLAGLGAFPTQQGAAYAEPVPPGPTAGPGDTATQAAVKAPPAPVGPLGTTSTTSTALPGDSGTGRRVVFDISAQRVWLVGGDGAVLRTYPVSGSVTDNLHPGDYEVYSRSRHAIGIDDSGVMEYFVRFAHGENAAIGFHSIPTKDGHPLQTVAELGTPQSHGCIRQRMADARRLWRFAPVGTDVRVVA